MESSVALKESIKDKVERRNEQANIMLQIIALSKKLTTSTYEIAEKLKHPEYIGDRDVEALRKHMDAGFWREILNEVQVEKYLTSVDKDKLFSKIEDETPVFNLEMVLSTVIGFTQSKEATATNMIKKIHYEITDLLFSRGNKGKGERRIQTGIPKMFRASIFYRRDGNLPGYVSSYDSRFNLINDLERACYLCDDKLQPDYQNAIQSKTDAALRDGLDQAENDYFHLKIYLNGNVKITFKNLEVLETLNKWGRRGDSIAS